MVSASRPTRRVFAFQRLDKQVRYATAVGNPGPEADGAYYMEFSTLNVAKDTSTGATPKNTRCHQWRVKSGMLQTRTWEVTPPPANHAYGWTGWRTVATGIMNNLSLGAERPFNRAPLYAGYVHRGLEVSLYVKRSDRPLGRAQVSPGSSPGTRMRRRHR